MNRRLPIGRLPRSVQIRYERNRLASTHLMDAYEQLVPMVKRALRRPTSTDRRAQERRNGA
jgi:hypothetical protein